MIFHVPVSESYDEARNEFIKYPEVTIKMESSLVAISKWESKYHKSFFRKNDKSKEEILYYMYCMVYEPEDLSYEHFLNFISSDRRRYNAITEHINDPMTAIHFMDEEKSHSSDTITSEIVYYQMIQYNIPVEFENWHINRLLTLIKVCAIKNSPKKKRSMRSIMEDYDRINELRKKQLGTRG